MYRKEAVVGLLDGLLSKIAPQNDVDDGGELGGDMLPLLKSIGANTECAAGADSAAGGGLAG